MQGNRAFLRLFVSLAVLAGVYVGLATFLSRHVPSNASVGGVAVGGMSPEQAAVTLNRVLAAKVSRPVHLKVFSRTIDIQPRTAGLEIDPAASLTDLSEFTLNPGQLWAHLTGTVEKPLERRVDRAKLSATVTHVARGVDSGVRQGSITFTGGKAAVVESVAGRAVRVRQTADAVASAWPDRQVVQAVVEVTKPKLAADEIRRAAREFAVPAMSAPVKVVAGATTILLQPGQYAPALSVTPDRAGTLGLRIDLRRLMVAIRAAAQARGGIERAPVDATMHLVDGVPVVVPAVVGMRLVRPASATSFLTALTSSKRTATIKLALLQPKVTTATAQGWRVKGAMSTFTTQFPFNPPRTNNIKIAIRTLNDTVVLPGAQFSLNATLGPRTPAKGYRQAPVIEGGRLITDYGGGVSQVSTTTFNAAFFAGVRFDRYTPHSFYISRYPEGREATVSWPDVDQQWTNNTGHVIFIQAHVSGNNVTVTLLGTKQWDIEAVKGPRRNVVQPRKIVDARPSCVPQLPTPGFDVTVQQIFHRNGAQVRTVTYKTHYIPEDDVRCTHPAAP
jgi:vancomycin resistance protein YoaR